LLIVPEKYHAWLLQAGYPRNAYRGNFTEKTLEHYLTVELLGFKPTDVVIDIASRNSPFVDIIERTVGCQIYEQDIIYPPGINGRRIGGNAAHIPLPDHSVDKMTLHCSFEHFEGTADGDFIRECGRLLVPGGQCAIVPLYISERCFHLTNPGCLVRHGLNFDADTPVIRDPLWTGSRFARFYDAESFNRRIVPHLGDSLEANVYFVENEKAVDQSCYVKFILLLANH
jgi:SAM-dependent methyltransferase